MSIKVGDPIAIIDHIPWLERVEFAQAILGDEYRKSVTAGDSPKPNPQANRVDRPIPVGSLQMGISRCSIQAWNADRLSRSLLSRGVKSAFRDSVQRVPSIGQ